MSGGFPSIFIRRRPRMHSQFQFAAAVVIQGLAHNRSTQLTSLHGFGLTIHTVLFDADGVLQRPTVWWREAFAPILGTADPARLEPFLRDVLEAESSALCTPSGFDDALAHVLIKWHRTDHLAEVLRVMNAINVYEEVMGVTQSLQQAGVKCHIASNQQSASWQSPPHVGDIELQSSLYSGVLLMFVGRCKAGSGVLRTHTSCTQSSRKQCAVPGR